jgi:pimeloyl-[acyl-carrier protein] methyl ester esterase
MAVDVKDIVLVHGWGLNSAVWNHFCNSMSVVRPDLRLHALDLPGYGEAHDVAQVESLSALADWALARVPDNAVWVGWSLGGMLALEAAMRAESGTIRGQVIIGAGAKFVASKDWPFGVEIATFEKFALALGQDYRAMLERFLLMQTGSAAGARILVKQIVGVIEQHPVPTLDTLRWGLACLEQVDLRSRLSKIGVPIRVVAGRLDRVAHPEAAERLARSLQCPYLELHTGHAPFLTHPTEVVSVVTSLLEELRA